MATAVQTGDIKKTLGERCAWPTLESVEQAVRTARRAANGARAATEDFVAGTTLEVRRHPLTAVGLAATAGIVTGCAFGFAAAWFWRRRE
jgi:ElaB/YqjD/DUF883 family membrane-anchored ribosome-binding protein